MNPTETAEPRNYSRPAIIWLAVFFGILALMLFKEKLEAPESGISQYAFEQLVDGGLIVDATVNYDRRNQDLNEVIGRYLHTNRDGSTGEIPFRTEVRLTSNLEEKLFKLPQFRPRQANTIWMDITVSVVPFLVVAVLIWYFFIRHIRKITRSSKSGAEMQDLAAEQQARYEKLLDRWEVQAQRMDLLLKKWEDSK